MKIEELQKQLEKGDTIFRGNCHDCGNEVNVSCAINENGEIVITGGAMYNPIFGVPPTKHTFFKCDVCFHKDRVLRNFIPCEIYSRIVGYLRPISQWNKGKVEEFKERKEFIVDKMEVRKR